MKVVLVGAGSEIFARRIIMDVLSFPELQDAHIALVDIDTERLALTRRLAERIVEQQRWPAAITATTERRDALQGADYVVCMIQVGGMDAWWFDREIPLKYGVDQAVGDTLGPGGVFRALRTTPAVLDICHDMEDLCPEALMINYANPMVINCWAMNEATEINNVGLCHSVQGTAGLLASFIGAPMEEIAYWVAGINHQAWFLRFEWNGEDAYPLLEEKMEDPEVFKREPVRFEIMRHFGYFVTESSPHMSEYVPYFRKSKPQIDQWLPNRWTWTRESVRQHRLEREQKVKAQLDSGEIIPVDRSLEYGAYIIRAMETNIPFRINGNVDNMGLITNLPEEATVEVPCLVDGTGVQPCIVGALPAQLAAINRTNLNVQELAVQAILEEDRDAVHMAIALDPLTAAVLPLDKIHEMVEEMLEAEAQWLPQFER